MNSAFALPCGDPAWCGRPASCFSHAVRLAVESCASKRRSRSPCACSRAGANPWMGEAGRSWAWPTGEVANRRVASRRSADRMRAMLPSARSSSRMTTPMFPIRAAALTLCALAASPLTSRAQTAAPPAHPAQARRRAGTSRAGTSRSRHERVLHARARLARARRRAEGHAARPVRAAGQQGVSRARSTPTGCTCPRSTTRPWKPT